MKQKIINYIECPICRNPLDLIKLELEFSEIKTGILQCKDNKDHIFPIINFIPRFFRNSFHEYYFLLKEFENDFSERIKSATNSTLPFINDKYSEHIRKSFSSEWIEYGDGNDAWGQSLETRRNITLECFNITSENLSNKTFLDVGCGHDEVIFSLKDYVEDIFAIDISNFIDTLQKKINLNSPTHNNIHLFQANLYELPFKNGIFDFVHSGGVLHHTPSTYAGFKSIIKPLKNGSLCFIEVYSEDYKNLIEKILLYPTDIIRKITYRLPHPILHFFCYIGSPFIWLFINIFNLLSQKDRYIKRNLKTLELSLFDSLSPRFDWRHSTKEVYNWFKQEGFIKINNTMRNHNCIGFVGEKQKNNLT